MLERKEWSVKKWINNNIIWSDESQFTTDKPGTRLYLYLRTIIIIVIVIVGHKYASNNNTNISVLIIQNLRMPLINKESKIALYLSSVNCEHRKY